MSNIHTPQRLEGETQEQYKQRRAASKAAGTRCAVRELSGEWLLTGETLQLRGLGNQRQAPSSRQSLRDKQRLNGRGPRASYGAGLLQPQRKRNQERMEKRGGLRDEHGAFTLIGKDKHGGKRKWLAGISAQRGY